MILSTKSPSGASNLTMAKRRGSDGDGDGDGDMDGVGDGAGMEMELENKKRWSIPLLLKKRSNNLLANTIHHLCH